MQASHRGAEKRAVQASQMRVAMRPVGPSRRRGEEAPGIARRAAPASRARSRPRTARAACGRSAPDPPAILRGPDGRKAGARIGVAGEHRVAHVEADLVAFGAYRRPEPRMSRTGGTPVACTPASTIPAAIPRQPACRAATHRCLPVAEEERQAVGGEHRADEVGRAGHDAVCRAAALRLAFGLRSARLHHPGGVALE